MTCQELMVRVFPILTEDEATEFVELGADMVCPVIESGPEVKWPHLGNMTTSEAKKEFETFRYPDNIVSEFFDFSEENLRNPENFDLFENKNVISLRAPYPPFHNFSEFGDYFECVLVTRLELGEGEMFEDFMDLIDASQLPSKGDIFFECVLLPNHRNPWGIMKDENRLPMHSWPTFEDLRKITERMSIFLNLPWDVPLITEVARQLPDLKGISIGLQGENRQTHRVLHAVEPARAKRVVKALNTN